MARFAGIAFGVTPHTTEAWSEIVVARDTRDVRIKRTPSDRRADDPVTVRFGDRQPKGTPRLFWSEGAPECVAVAVAAPERESMSTRYTCGTLTTTVLTPDALAERHAVDVGRAVAEWGRFRSWCRDNVGFDPGAGALLLVVD